MATVLPRAFQKNCPARRSALSHGTKNPEELDSACAVIPSIWAAFQPAAPVYTSKQLMSRGFAAVPILRANGHSIDLAGNMPACWSTAAPVTISRFDSEFRFALGTESAYGNLTKKNSPNHDFFVEFCPKSVQSICAVHRKHLFSVRRTPCTRHRSKQKCISRRLTCTKNCLPASNFLLCKLKCDVIHARARRARGSNWAPTYRRSR
jgi:hypothetical protein